MLGRCTVSLERRSSPTLPGALGDLNLKVISSGNNSKKLTNLKIPNEAQLDGGKVALMGYRLHSNSDTMSQKRWGSVLCLDTP